MEDTNPNPNPNNSSSTPTPTTITPTTTTTTMSQQQQQQQQQQQLFQQQLFLLQQYQQHQHQHHQNLSLLHPHQPQNPPSQPPHLNLQHQQHQQQQHHHQSSSSSAIARFPSNIDAHLRPPGLRSLHSQPSLPSSAPPTTTTLQFQQQQQHQQQAKAVAATAATAAGGAVGIRQGNPIEVEMAHHDALRVCNPDVKNPFSSVEDAVHRLLPYHVVSDYEAEEDDRILDSDTTGQLPSRLQQWDHNILAKIAEFTTTFEKQVLAFNIMSRKRSLGEFRSEERLMIEQLLLQEEKQSLLDVRTEIESREKASREAVEAKMRMAMAQAEQARAEAHAHAEMMARGPMRPNAIGSHGDDGSGSQDVATEHGGNMEMIHGWGNSNNHGQRDDDEPSDDFLNDENEPENGEEAGLQEQWREVGELDLNTR